jgi:hypothetical protein
MNCVLAILLPNFSYGHDTSCPSPITILCTFWVTNHNYIFDKVLGNPSFWGKKLLDIGFSFIE